VKDQPTLPPHANLARICLILRSALASLGYVGPKGRSKSLHVGFGCLFSQKQ
jgi:hypothetical protein